MCCVESISPWAINQKILPGPNRVRRYKKLIIKGPFGECLEDGTPKICQIICLRNILCLRNIGTFVVPVLVPPKNSKVPRYRSGTLIFYFLVRILRTYH